MSTSYIFYKDIAPGADEGAAFSAPDHTDFSTVTNLAKENATGKLVTLEPNRWILSGDYTLPPYTVPFWSASLSGEDRRFAAPPVISIALDDQYSSVGLTLIFEPSTGEYCSRVRIRWYQGGTLREERDFEPNGTTYFCQNTVTSFDSLDILLLETNLPRRRARLNQVIFGIHRRFYMDELRSVHMVHECDIASLRVPISTITWELDSRADVQFMFQLKQPIEAWNDDKLVGVYYIDSYSRAAESLYSIDGYDAFGVLDEGVFAGGVYDAYSAKALLRDIVGTDFDLVFEAEDTTLTGLLRGGSKRDAIQQVLFAWGVIAATDGRRDIRVFMPPEAKEAIGEGSTYTGAVLNVSSIVTEVRVTAHTYAEAENGSVEIGGVRYADTKTVYTVRNQNVTANDKANVMEVTNATLISPDIGQAVAQRVYDYYSRRNTANAKIVWTGQRLGDLVELPTPWQETISGNISKMKITLSNTVAADLEVIG